MTAKKVVLLCGGVGGVKLAQGLAHAVGEENLTVIVNIGDDFTHIGLRICPDIDTVLYTLSGRSDSVRGWGRSEETWSFMNALSEIGGPDWFQLGDKDLALHVDRTRRLNCGESLTGVTARIASAFGLGSSILPVSDDAVSTLVHTDKGALPFQDYFVKQRCAPAVQRLEFIGAETARASAEVEAALKADDLSAIVIAPSNPWLSIDPILSIPPMTDLLKSADAPILAVTPIPGGQAVKGPTAKIMRELALSLTPSSIIKHYSDILDGILLDTKDAPFDSAMTSIAFTDTLMHRIEDKIRVAEAVLHLADAI